MTVEEQIKDKEQKVVDDSFEPYKASKAMRVMVWAVMTFVLVGIIVNGLIGLKETFFSPKQNQPATISNETPDTTQNPPNSWGNYRH